MTKKLKATIQAQRELRIKPAPFAVRNIGDLNDTDISATEDGSVLVYKESTNKWTATRLLDNQFIEGGHF